MTVCPRIVLLKGPGSTIRVPDKVCSLSAKVIEIPPKVVLCSLKSIDVVDTWTPEPEQEHKLSTVVEGLRVSLYKYQRLTMEALDMASLRF